MPPVSILIRCYNEEKHIGRLLRGIVQQNLDDVEIIVVDSGSTDKTVSIVSKYATQVLSVRPEEFSFGRSLNVGLGAASGDFAVLASAHVYPLFTNWLERLLLPFEDPQVSCVYGKQIGNEMTKFSEHQVFAKWFPDKSNLKQDHPFCNNANAAIRLEVWKAVPYNEELTGLEDIDWAYRAMQLDYRIAYQANAVVVHVHEESPLQMYNRYRREAMALKRIFPNEHFHLGDFLRLFSGNVLSDYRHALRDGSLKRHWFDIQRFRCMQFWGTYQGFARSGPVTSKLKRKFYYPEKTPRLGKNTLYDIKEGPLVDYRAGE